MFRSQDIQKDSFLSSHRFFYAITISILISLFSLLDEQFAQYVQYILFILGSIVIGLPHGATDNYIFFKTHDNKNKKFRFTFFAGYILLALAALLFWFLLPEIFVLVFLLYSAFHFGQSNWFYLPLREAHPVKIFQYVVWGGFVILTPILLHSGESAKIITIISRQENALMAQLYKTGSTLIIFLIVLNLVMVAYHYLSKRIDTGILLKEGLSILILSFLFFSTPLYLSFFTYWIFFHSFNSIIETSHLLHKSRDFRSIFSSLKKALPLSIITYLGIGISVILFTRYDVELMISIYFVIIACLTIPHMLVIQSVYSRLSKHQVNNK